MAVVDRIEVDGRGFRGVHPTHVVAKYIVGQRDGHKLLQLNSYGSKRREMPDKLSQTLLFDKTSARQLWEVLGKEFGFR